MIDIRRSRSDRTFGTLARRIGATLLGATLMAATYGEAEAQNYPQRAITIVVPFAAGGGTDSIAREVAAHLQTSLGQPVVVENAGGGGGSIGSSRVANADPDGYTLLFVTSTFVTHAAVESGLPYDVVKSFTPIAQLGRGPLIVVTNKDVPVGSIGELVSKAKADPEAFNYASAGPGSINHLSGALFNQLAGTTMTHVPYKGSGPATFDLLSGAVQVFFATTPTMLGQVKAKEVKLLATTGAERSPLFPDTPTVKEAGIEGFEVYTWWGIVGPSNLPRPIVEQLNKAINDVVALDSVRGRLIGEGAEIVRGTPDQLAQTISSELTHWRKLVADAGIAKK
ncbi:tripartite tricarboxylate transporter substrate binding protein [Bosea sp. 117]|uniref:Bug family tripartite tricarboxylate transporter substrate binding protein n=1 Tax=Bosea sp. 117 TaxID=1125973 RepID=UPI0006904EEB|nr:tripartite tricarboxylate transporter substrate binding protein [Bosea sp. 117]